MKFMHLSDLHIGKRVNEFNMLEDQKYILNEIIKIADNIEPNVILIAGDIYDKSMPSAEAVELFDEFLTEIAKRNLKCFVISGNHDSAERIAFGSRIMEGQGIYMSKVFGGRIDPIVLKDSIGEINLYMLPFIKPANVRRFYPDSEIESYEDAIKTVIENSHIDITKRNILVAHQFVTNSGIEPDRCDSENISVGGLDMVDASVFDCFDYVALGHLHGPQKIGRDTIRYAGSPLKYSFSESRQNKSITVIDFDKKENIKTEKIPLIPLRDMREIKGPINELVNPENYKGTNLDDYIHITLTDEDDIMDAIGKLRMVYPNVMRLDFDNKQSRALGINQVPENINLKSHCELFKEFYTLQNNDDLDDFKIKIISELFEELGGVM
ncbi:exonuclease SbcD [Sedimentibacter acidaminivorans]|uniref:Nuclease SbcCD subunit D n=1 Tax=Sedimentibacter acidaminivorans TaxID=913099 RepID=A0ABS4GCV1_9FIRM|nr:exonuclease SbcCD subunit D [Sedimentibacter acidaminivorans]MBP1925504.1 exonuclease SbcD [Sedimentibacter acidaminivorans]